MFKGRPIYVDLQKSEIQMPQIKMSAFQTRNILCQRYNKHVLYFELQKSDV